MNILIVHTDAEPHCFVSALRNAFAARASACGHQVTISDLCAIASIQARGTRRGTLRAGWSYALLDAVHVAAVDPAT